MIEETYRGMRLRIEAEEGEPLEIGKRPTVSYHVRVQLKDGRVFKNTMANIPASYPPQSILLDTRRVIDRMVREGKLPLPEGTEPPR